MPGSLVIPDVLTHYYRPFSRPLLSLSALPEPDLAAVLAGLGRHEPLPYRLIHPEYMAERRRMESLMRDQFATKGGRPQREHPHYFVLGEFSLWEADASKRVQIALAAVAPDAVSFTLTDSFFNYRSRNLRGIDIPPRPYHGQLFTLAELPAQVALHGLPGEAWRVDETRRFDVYVEAQLWSDDAVRDLLREPQRA
jgi:hypothetical protein